MELISTSIVCGVVVLLAYYCIKLKASELAFKKENVKLGKHVADLEAENAKYKQRDAAKPKAGPHGGKGTSMFQPPDI